MNENFSNLVNGGAQPTDSRLKAVMRYQKHNMNNLKNLDDVVLLASQICDAPIAYISLIDDVNQFFISKKGLEIDCMPRTESFCNQTVQQKDLVVVEDLKLHQFYSKHKSVSEEPHLRFYAGMPVHTTNGDSIGTICILDVKPKALNSYQREYLRMLSTHVVYLLELRIALDLVSEQRKVVESEAMLKEKYFAQNKQIMSVAKVLAHQVSGPVATMKGLMHLMDTLPFSESREYFPLMNLVIEQMDEAVRLVAASAFAAAREDAE